MRIVNHTTQGIGYSEDLCCSGAYVILFPGPEHSQADRLAALEEIRHKLDIVSLRLATKEDYDELFRSEIFRHPLTKPLHWFEINAEREVVALRPEGITVDEYVKQFVLPSVDQIRAYNTMHFGDKILKP